MGRAPCCEKVGLKRGRWTAEEDEILTKYIQANGEGSWRSLPKKAGLLRCGKSCRLRWVNYLRADLKRGNITADEEETIVRLRTLFGNKWSLIATNLPGRTDNEIKNYWNSHLSRKVRVFTTTVARDEPSLIADELASKKSASSSGDKKKKKKKKKNKGRTSRSATKKHEQAVASLQLGQVGPTGAGASRVVEGSSVEKDKIDPDGESGQRGEMREKGQMGHFEICNLYPNDDPHDESAQRDEMREKGQKGHFEVQSLGPYEWLDRETERLMSGCIWENGEVMRVIDDSQDRRGEDGDMGCLGLSEEQQVGGTKFGATKVGSNVEMEREGSVLSSNSDEGGNKDWWVDLCSSEASFGFDGEWLNWGFQDSFTSQGDLWNLEILG